jgi:hypothetical protein
MTNCSCIKKEAQAFDLLLDSYDCRGFVITDLSNWMKDDNYKIPEKFKVEIILPNKSKKDIDLLANSTTKISNVDIGYESCIPNGIYCFKTTSCGYSYTRIKAVTCSLECALNDFVAKSNNWETINKIKDLILAVKTSAELGLEKQAQELYNVVKKEIDALSCKCSC